MSQKKKVEEYRKRVDGLELTKDLVEFQHKKGKLTVKERLKTLLDEDSFREVGAFTQLQSNNFDLQSKKKARDGIITGYGAINKKPVYIYAQDFTFMGGSMGAMHTSKIASVMDLALKNGTPLIGLFDSGGARIQEGIKGLDGGGKIFYRNTIASGIIPQISVIMGPCAGIAVYSPALTDFVFMVDKISHMFITGPDVIKSVTGEKIDFEGLGGAAIHNQKSGVAHFIAKDEKECFNKIKQLLSYLPSNNLESPPVINMGDNQNRKNEVLNKIIPDDPKKSYDAKDVIKEIVDKNSFLEVHKHYAQNAVVGFARLNNEVVGIVANQTKILAGVLDINCSDKISRFVRFCDCFNIPLINLVDVSGYLPGTDQERNGIIRHGAKILYAYSEATVPKISLVMRKAYGGAYIALVSKDMGYDIVIAWPNAEIAVMGAEQAVNIIYRKEITSAKKSDKIKEEKIKEFSDKFMNPYLAAESGKVDMIIEPKETRSTLIKCLDMLRNKRSSISEKRKYKKHGNIPL